MDSAWVSVMDQSTEGGEATGYFRDGELLIARLWLLGETGKVFTSFYYAGGQPEVIHWTDFRYNRPFYWNEQDRQDAGDTEVFDPARTKVIEHRFYFQKGKKIFHEEIGDRAADGSDVIADTSLLSLALDLRRMLRDAHARKEPFPAEAMDWRQPDLTQRKNCAFKADTMAAGIVLGDEMSAIAAVGRTPFEALIEETGMPHVNFTNAHGSQVLTLFLHHGSGENQFSEIRITRQVQDSIRAVLPVPEFRSGRGILLGMREEDAKAILGGYCAVGTASNGHRLLRYAIVDFAASHFLQAYNYPSYYATLEFAADRLIEYRFGFEYP